MEYSKVTKVQMPAQHWPANVYIHMVNVLWILCLLLCHTSSQNFDFPPTMFTQQPQAGSIEVQGNTKVLLCYANGIPPPVYRWKKDDRYTTPGNITDTSLKIQNIQRSDAGEYQCLASNTQGAILSNRVHVHIAYMVPFANAGNQEKSVDQGLAKVIDLPPIDSYPAPSVRWFEGYGMPIRAETQRYHVTLKNQLVILETRLNTDNNKLFKATALNSYTGQSSDSQTFVLKVQNVGDLVNDIPPELVIPPTHTTAVQGDDAAVKLECVANARPLNYLSLNWYKKSASGERILIEPDNVKYLLSMYRRVLTIKNPVIDDSGAYICEATFNRPGGPSLPPASAQANLTIHVKPNFATPPPSEMSQDVGTTLDIPCQAVGTPLPTINWYRNGENVNVLPKERFAILESGSLQITDTIPGDSGMYQCFVRNQAAEMNAATWVRVLSSPPEIITKPNNKSIIAGDNAQFACQVTGAPTPEVSWYRVTVGGVTEDLPTGRVQVREDGLFISVSQVSDTGKYVCNATNNKGTDIAMAWLTVTLRTRIVAPPQDASVIKGSNIDMQCGVTHDPTVTVRWYWYHNNGLIPPTDDRRQLQADGRLEIISVRNDDIGTYRCDVVSVGGNDTASANIKVIELPYSPSVTSVSLNAQSNRAVDVQWNPGFDGNSPIKKFVVQYRLYPSGDVLMPNEGWQVADNDVPFEQRTYTVGNLQPARSYQFRISAVNDVGEGPPSTPSLVVELPQQAPSGPPRGVVGSPRSNSSIIIQWQPPDEDKWNGQLLGYMVSYKLSGYPDNTLQHENITNYLVTMYELKRLIVFQEYEIAVAAYNKKGKGVYSDYVQVRTQEGRPTEPPTNVQVIPVNSTAIKITWMPPDPQYINGINQGYKVEASLVNSVEPPFQMTIPSNTSNMLGLQTGHLTGLLKYTQYAISVLCFTSKGDGPSTDPVVARTVEDVPEQVGSLNFDGILDTSLRVLWTPPGNVNGILTGYTLSYMKKNQTITKVTKELGPAALNYIITGLTATTIYTIEVFAKTRMGAGPQRSADIESGVPPELPEAPHNLAITNILATSVLLQFVPGFSGHTSISKWLIQAQKHGNMDNPWEDIFTTSAPEAVAITVEGLSPYTKYRLKMKAENIAGQSPASEPTRWFDTLQAPPASPPKEVTVRAVNETAQRVRWTPLSADEWNGEQRGYRLQYKTSEESEFVNTVLVADENANSYVLGGLQEFTRYDVKGAAYNKVGYSPYSPVTSDTTRESVPSAGPANVTAIAQSSTSILVTWSEVPKPHQNGEIKGYKVQYRSSQANIDAVQKVIETSEVRQTRLLDLKKFVWYEVQVLAYTRIGDGVLSSPPVEARTHEDVPGPPASVFFPEVTQSTAKAVWSPPREPNGFIIGYRVAYRSKADPPSYAIVDDSLGPGRRDFYVSTLERNTYYVFTVTARTQLGWGTPAELEVYTIINRRVPLAPTRPSIGPSQIGDRWVTINWQPGNDGYGPIRNFTIQIQKQEGAWEMVPDYVGHNLTTYTITGLKPNTKYRFQVAAYNDLGLSPYSTESEQVTTKQAAPESAPVDLNVIPKTTTSVLVSWRPPSEDSWNGDPVGYRIWYAQLRYAALGIDESYQHVEVTYPRTEVSLDNLVGHVVYEVKVTAFSGLGDGPATPPFDIYVGEAVPMAAPRDVNAQTKSSTEIKLSWKPPPLDEQNGDLLGYKLFYWVLAEKEGTSQMRTVAAADSEVVLDGLQVYTEYSFIMLAFNAAGDGPNTTVPAVAWTSEGVPGQPGPLVFVVTSLNSLNVSWTPPEQANGEIEQFELSYYQESLVDGESRSVQVKLSGDKRNYHAKELTENVRYVFTVKAKTQVAWGPGRVGNVTIGPQAGSPGEPSTPLLSTSDKSVTMSWSNGAPGESPINGYIIQGREKQGLDWETLQNKDTADRTATISFFDLKPKTEYQFRVIAMNSRGISPPSQASEYVMTIDVDEKPFYQQWWFLIIVALVGVIFIIIVISLLCLTGRRRKNKYKEGQAANELDDTYQGDKFPPNNGLPRTLVQLSEPSSSNEGNDGGFHTFETQASQRRSQRARGPPRNNTLPPYSNPAFRSPPRPSPGSVNYSDGEEAKAYGGDDDNSSVVTDKPSEVSSSASRDGSQCSDSEPESEKEPPPAFSSSYVTNGDVRQSWKRQGPYSNGSAYNYTDSEQESQYGITLNGGHIIMNNMAGSRAPLPGFSSFV